MQPAIELLRTTGDHRTLARALADLAMFANVADDHPTARSAAEEAFALADPAGDAAVMGEALSALAHVADDLDEGLAIMRRAVDHLRTAGALERLAQAFSGIGVLGDRPRRVRARRGARPRSARDRDRAR